jgi:hypothetical protein
MDESALRGALAASLPPELAKDFVKDFLDIRTDVATGTLGRASPGKFSETAVQALQSLERAGSYDAQPNVEGYLRGLESRASTLPDGLRICASRLARAMYALRSKRNIVHKALVDPTLYDLKLLYAASQWILTELLALSPALTGDQASRLIAQVQLPAGELVEVLGDRRLVYGTMSVRDEALVLLMTHYPDPVATANVLSSMDRRSRGSVRNTLSELWKEKLLHRPSPGHLVLTQPGLREAIAVAQRHAA